MPTPQPSPLIQYGGMVLNALQRGVSGDQFAESVETMIGPLQYSQIADAGKEAIIGEMKSVPEFWNQVAPYANSLDKFVSDFIAYGQGGEEGEEE